MAATGPSPGHKPDRAGSVPNAARAGAARARAAEATARRPTNTGRGIPGCRGRKHGLLTDAVVPDSIQRDWRLRVYRGCDGPGTSSGSGSTVIEIGVLRTSGIRRSRDRTFESRRPGSGRCRVQWTEDAGEGAALIRCRFPDRLGGELELGRRPSKAAAGNPVMWRANARLSKCTVKNTAGWPTTSCVGTMDVRRSHVPTISAKRALRPVSANARTVISGTEAVRRRARGLCFCPRPRKSGCRNSLATRGAAARGPAGHMSWAGAHGARTAHSAPA